MRETMHATLTAIGCQLHAEYLPTLARPLPRKLKGLIAQLVALESEGRPSRSKSSNPLSHIPSHGRDQPGCQSGETLTR
jgi:hypothetical protein